MFTYFNIDNRGFVDKHYVFILDGSRNFSYLSFSRHLLRSDHALFQKCVNLLGRC